MLKVVHDVDTSNGPAGGSLLDEIVRDGAQAMLAAALQAEFAAYVEAFADELDERGRRLVVRNGSHAPREVMTAAGAIGVRAPRVNDRRVDEVTGERKRFASAILPAWCRKSPKVAEVLPLLYLHGLSSGDFGPALEQFLGSAAGLSAATITRLTAGWQDEAAAFNKRSLAGTDYVYIWVDGIHVKVRLEQDKVCLLVIIGVRAGGTKELVGLDDGYRESAESWANLLRDCQRRGMQAPVLAVGDGALGFWAAVREMFPAHPRATVLVPQDRQRAQLPTQIGPARRESGSGRDLERRRPRPRRRSREELRRPVRPEMAQSRRQDHRRPRRTAGVLQLPRRALDPPAHQQPDRVDLRHRPTPATSHQRPRIPGRRRGDGVQTDRVRPSQMASSQRTPPRRTRPRRSPLRQRPAGRTTPQTRR